MKEFRANTIKLQACSVMANHLFVLAGVFKVINSALFLDCVDRNQNALASAVLCE